MTYKISDFYQKLPLIVKTKTCSWRDRTFGTPISIPSHFVSCTYFSVDQYESFILCVLLILDNPTPPTFTKYHLAL